MAAAVNTKNICCVCVCATRLTGTLISNSIKIEFFLWVFFQDLAFKLSWFFGFHKCTDLRMRLQLWADKCMYVCYAKRFANVIHGQVTL